LGVVKSGAWRCLFFLVQELSSKKSGEVKISETLKKLAETSGWKDEYTFIEPYILDILSGKPVDTNAIIEGAIAEGNKTVESTLLIATDEDCLFHIPLVKGPADKRAKQASNYDENEERIKVLVGTPPSGLLLMDSYLDTDLWLNNCQEASIADILRVHEYSYIKSIMYACAKAGESIDIEGKLWSKG
jgi:hypothetical protein